MLWNDDIGKENTESLTCETLCEQECKPCGCFAIINQRFNMGVNENQIIYFTLSHGPQFDWAPGMEVFFFLLQKQNEILPRWILGNSGR